jgi:AcrR family transcriptional regulator
MASLDERTSYDASAGESGGRRSGGNDGDARQPVGPLYKRLPPGPHHLERDQVLRHQRLRIHGAMVAAVAADGYEATSVKQLIALAGVSRRSFYEHFANKQECFLATFDLLARRVVTSVRASCDTECRQLQERLGAPLAALARFAAEDPNSMTLLLDAAPRLGLTGTKRLCQASAACERMLGAAFTACPGADALPAPALRAIAGGVQAGILARLTGAELSARGQAELAGELLGWVLHFATPSAGRLTSRVPGRAQSRRPRA